VFNLADLRARCYIGKTKRPLNSQSFIHSFNEIVDFDEIADETVEYKI